MKRRFLNVCFVLIGSFIAFSTLSCNNIISLQKATQVSFNLNLSEASGTLQKQSGFLNRQVTEETAFQISVSLFQVTDSASGKENQELDTSKLILLESITPSIAQDGKIFATFNEVMVGIDAVIFVEIYETDTADASQNLAYNGHSEVFTVQKDVNAIGVELKKIISTLEKLTTVLQSTTEEPIYIAGNFEVNSTLDISKPTTLIADTTTTFSRAESFTGALFTNSADFTLQGSENAIITIDGNDIEATAPAIKSTANLTLTYCNFENNITTSTDGGAIFVETTAEVTLNASNCNFTNNKVTVSATAGGAVAIDGSKVNSTITKSNFINNLAENNGGGALYISGSSTTNYLHTISDSQFNDNKTEAYDTNYGGAIYLSQGSLELNNISMNNNRYYSSEDSYSSSDIFIYKNYTNVTLCGTIIINSLVDNFGSGTDNPVIKLENFSTESQIGVLCTAGTGASVDDGDPLITPNDGEELTSEQIACFTSIEDSNGVQYTLNVDGTITPNN